MYEIQTKLEVIKTFKEMIKGYEDQDRFMVQKFEGFISVSKNDEVE